MADIFSKTKRSEIMSKIGSKDTKIENLVSCWLHMSGLRFRKNNKSITGTPDISIKKYKIAIFVHGCFWHGHEGCSKAALPSTNKAFWKDKIEKNKARDERVTRELNDEGWHVFVLWECELQRDFEDNIKTLTDEIFHIISSFDKDRSKTKGHLTSR